MTENSHVTPAIGARNGTDDRAGRLGSVSEARASPVLVTDRRIEMVPVDRLIASERNARTHSEKQIRQIAGSIRNFGFNNPVLVDDGNELIAGHGRLEAAKLLGLDSVPALRLSHLTAAEQRAYVIADNRIAENAGWDREILALELQNLIDLDFQVQLTGFELGEMDIILGDADEAKGERTGSKNDVVRPSSGPTISRAGDLWLLDTHQLLCGDACDGIDAAIKSWQANTGKAATLAASGQSFAEIEKERARSASQLAGIAQPSMTAVGRAR
jgi:hypothetical protein